MNRDLQGLFDRALADEPELTPADLVSDVIAQGSRIRRRRRLMFGGSALAAVIAVFTALNLALPADSPAPVLTPAAMMARSEPECAWGVRSNAAGVVILLSEDITGPRRADLRAALQADPLVRDLRFETRQQAYERFVKLWKQHPDLRPAEFADGSLRESFRMTLADRRRYAEFADRFRDRAGVEDLVGVTCPGPAK